MRAIFGFAIAALLATLLGYSALATTDGYQPIRAATQPVSGVYISSPSTLSTGERDELRLTAAGQLRVSAEGQVAHDAADSGNPVKIGAIGRATFETAASTAGDRVNVSADLYGRLRVVAGCEATAWTIKHTPAANNQATISKAAVASTRHVARGYAWSLSSGAGAPTPELITIAIRDGATGAGTIIWEETVSLPATAGSSARGGMTGLYLVGTANTAMTIETDSAPGANVVASVSLWGESIP